MNSALSWVLARSPSLVFLSLPMACPSLLNITNGTRHLNPIRLDLSFTPAHPSEFPCHTSCRPSVTHRILSYVAHLPGTSNTSPLTIPRTYQLLCCVLTSLWAPSSSDIHMTCKLTSQIFTQISSPGLSLTACPLCDGVSYTITGSQVVCPSTVTQRPRLMGQPLSPVVLVARPDSRETSSSRRVSRQQWPLSLKVAQAPSTHNSSLRLTTRGPGSTVQLHVWKGVFRAFPTKHFSNGYTN